MTIFLYATLEIQSYRAGRGLRRSSNPCSLPWRKGGPHLHCSWQILVQSVLWWPVTETNVPDDLLHRFIKTFLMATLNILPVIQPHYFYTCPTWPRRTEYTLHRCEQPFTYLKTVIMPMSLHCSYPALSFLPGPWLPNPTLAVLLRILSDLWTLLPTVTRSRLLHQQLLSRDCCRCCNTAKP